MKDKFEDDFIKWFMLIIAIALIVGLCMQQYDLEKAETKISELTTKLNPQIIKEPYTIFQYTKSGHVNCIYAVEHYYATDNIYYLDKKTGVYEHIDDEGILPVKGYVEDETELQKYGVFKPIDVGEFGF